MKYIQRNFLFLVTLVLLGSGCKKTDFLAQEQAKATLRNVGDYINNNFNLTIFAAALQKTGLMDTLNNATFQYTVFVPDNNAFIADSILSPADLDRFSSDSLRFIVRNHITRGKLFYSDIPTSLDNLYLNLNGLNLYASKTNGGNQPFAVSGVTVEQIQSVNSTGVVYDVPLANGVLHIMSRVMKYNKGTVRDFIGGRPDLGYFASGLKKFALWDSLATAGPFTIVAPVNGDFDMNHITIDTITGLDTMKVQPVLFGGYVAYPHHLFTTDLNMVVSANLVVSGGYMLALGSGVQLTGPDGRLLGPLKGLPNYDQRITPYLDANSTDYLCSNGIVHLLGQLLVLPGDVPK